MKTSSFFLYSGDGRVSIARSAPRNLSGFRIYRSLAPGDWFKSTTKEEYEARFFGEILAPLNPRVVWNELHALVAPYEPVLLCWERLQREGEWCHRQMVARWFETELGIVVPEIRVKKPETIPMSFGTE